jgi:hypothetical protein
VAYQIISGAISDLKIGAGRCDLGIACGDKALAGGVNMLAAVMGEAVNAGAASSSDTDISMDFFTCTVDSREVSGSFYKLGFSNGDVIEFVVHDDDGRLLVAAARDPEKRYIWVQPYKTRGNRAQKRHDIFWGGVISLGLPLLAAGYFTYRTFVNLNKFSWVGVGTRVLLFFVFGTINYLVRSRFYPPSFDATEIFRALGFKDPANVDLPKGLRAAEKKWAEQTGGGYVPDIPWRYRY